MIRGSSEADGLATAGRRLGWLREWDRILFAAAALWGALYYLHFQFQWTAIFSPIRSRTCRCCSAAALIALHAARRARTGIRAPPGLVRSSLGHS